jgi:hypothetical protein
MIETILTRSCSIQLGETLWTGIDIDKMTQPFIRGDGLIPRRDKIPLALNCEVVETVYIVTDALQFHVILLDFRA